MKTFEIPVNGFGRMISVVTLSALMLGLEWNSRAAGDNTITTPSGLTTAYQLTADTTVSGTGALSVSGSAQFGTDGTSRTLTVQSGIQGSALFGSNAGALYSNVSLNNLGTINANLTGQTLTIGGNGTSVTNTGTFEATSGGLLNLTSTASIADGGGVISALGAGSIVSISTTVEGGTLTTSTGGVIQTSGSATLDASTVGAITLTDGSTYTTPASNVTSINGTLNLGTVTGSTLALAGQLRLLGDTTFAGPGTVIMTAGQIGGDGTVRTLTNQKSIQGSGLIGSNTGLLYSTLSLNNIGTINANQNGQTLTIGGNGTSVTNSGTFEATNGAVLDVATAATVFNAGGLIASSGTGSTVNISTAIQGGTLTTSSGGVMQTSGNVTLDASTSGAITLTDGTTYTANSGLTSVTGTLKLGISTGATLALGGQLRLVGDTTFSAPGTVIMSAGQIGSDGTLRTLTNPTLIQGSGVIGSNVGSLYSSLNLNNNGTINANQTGQVLNITGTGTSITNTGTFEATNGGVLDLTTLAIISNATGHISASGTGSTVNLSTTIQGGTLTTSSAGTFQTSGAATLDASTSGAITLTDGSTFTATNSGLVSITGNLKLGAATGSTFALQGQLRLIGDTTFSSPGTVIMTAGQIGGDGTARTLTNQTVIQGSGTIGSNIGSLYSTLNLNNTRTINANQSGQSLTIYSNGTLLANTGTFEATNGGILDLTSSIPVGNGGGTIAASGVGSTVNISTTIQGGTLTTSGGGVMQTSGVSAFDGSTLGAITITDGSTVTAATGLNTIRGTLNLGAATGSTFALGGGQLQLVGDTTFAGPGTVTLSGAQIGTDGNNRILTNKSTISGPGLIGSNVGSLYSIGTLNNQGHLLATGGTLTIGETNGLTNTGTVQIDAGSTLTVGTTYAQTGTGTLLESFASASSVATMNVGSTVSLSGALDVSLSGGFVPTSGEELTIMTFASETGTFSSVALMNDPGQSFNTIYEPNDVKIQFVPEPTHLLVLSIGLLATLIRPRGRKSQAL